MMSEKQRLELLELVDALRSRGVMHFKQGDLEFTLAPQLVPGVEAVPDGTAKLDPTKCLRCQAAPQDGRISGYCRKCSLAEAGVAS